MLKLSKNRQEVDIMHEARKPISLKTLAWAYECALGIAVALLVVLTWAGATG